MLAVAVLLKGLKMNSKELVVGLSKSDGTITPGQFREGAHKFVEKWSKVCYDHDIDLPLWSWVPCLNPHFISSHQIDGYVSMERCILRSDKIDDDVVSHVEGVELNSGTGESNDHAILVQRAAHEVHYYDFHILYSSSYRIPVLYFRGYCSDGQPLMLDQIESDLPAVSAKLLAESKWTFITQQEHPYLNRPWYTLHPCGTNELMRLLSSTTLSKAEDAAESYIISWLSVVGQVVGLKMPLQMAIPHRQ